MSSNSHTLQIPLQTLIDVWKQEGYIVTPEQFLEANMILQSIAVNYPINKLGELLSPIFAKNVEQQKRFVQLFNRLYVWEYSSIENQNNIIGGQETNQNDKPFQVQEEVSQSKKDASNILWSGVIALAATAILFTSNAITGKEPRDVYIIIAVLEWALVIVIAIAALSSRKEQNEELSPPYTFLPNIKTPKIQFFSKAEEYTLLSPFQKKTSDVYNTQKIDIRKTLKTTIRHAGFVQLEFQQYAPPQAYLVLIDRLSVYNHTAQWFNYITQLLQEGEVEVQKYFYDTDPRICWNEKEEKFRLESLYQQQRLIFIGDARGLVNDAKGALYSWAKKLLGDWESKAILTPLSAKDWQFYEQCLEDYFAFAPATIEGLLKIIAHFDGHEDSRIVNWKDGSLSYFDDIEWLKQYLPENIYHWLAACAAYPELYWQLTLHIGEILEKEKGELLNKENLAILSQIPWFKDGEISHAIREKLLQDLPKDKEKIVRKAIVDLLKNHEPLPAENSYAHQDYRLTLLRNELVLIENERERQWKLRELQQLLKKNETSDLDIQSYAKLKKPNIFYRVIILREFLLEILKKKWLKAFRKNEFNDENSLLEIKEERLSNENKIVKIFIFYSKHDKTYLNKLLSYLQPLTLLKSIEICSEEEIENMKSWDNVLKTKKNDSDIILLLITPDLLFDDYFYEKEIEIIMAEKNSIIVPILVKHTDLEFTPLSVLQVLPSNNLALNQWENQNKAYEDIAKGIEKIINNIHSQPLVDDTPYKIFIAYSRNDSHYLTKLLKYLAPIEGENMIKIWYDGLIIPGSDWHKAIQKNLNDADVILLLISANSLSSDYFYKEEMKKALARNEKSIVIPVILEPCRWDLTELNAIQGLPKNSNSIIEFENEQLGYQHIVDEIVKALNFLPKKSIRQNRYNINSLINQSNTNNNEAARVFIAYNRRDIRYLEEIYKHLKTPIRRNIINVWYDGNILPGSEWEKEIKRHINEIHMILLLISQNSLESEYFREVELIRSLELFERGAVYIIPVILSPCEWRKYNTGLEDIQFFPKNNQPISTWKTPARAYTQLTSEILEQVDYVKQLRERHMKERRWKQIRATPEGNILFDIIKDIEQDMIFIEGGSFHMGSNRNSAEKPLHSVKITSFQISRYPVKQSHWETVMGNNPSNFKKNKNYPVDSVSWYDVKEFIEKLNSLTNENFRLPSEAEWEYAAKGGKYWRDEFEFAGSNDANEVAWYNKNSSNTIHIVGNKKPNQLGLFDMSGNINEWCEDDWHNNYVRAPMNGSTWIDSKREESKVVRGGSWRLEANDCRSAYRFECIPSTRLDDLGFRLVRSAF